MIKDKRTSKTVVIGVIAAAAVITLAMMVSANSPALTTEQAVSNSNCLAQSDIKAIMPSLKLPTHLPVGYQYKCAVGSQNEAEMLYWNKTIDKTQFHVSIRDFAQQNPGSIMMRMSKDPQITNGTATVIKDYNAIAEGNPGLSPQLIDINGKLAWGNEAAPNGGKQTATWPDETVLTNTFSVPARLRTYDDQGTITTLEGYVPLKKLADMAKSLQ